MSKMLAAGSLRQVCPKCSSRTGVSVSASRLHASARGRAFATTTTTNSTPPISAPLSRRTTHCSAFTSTLPFIHRQRLFSTSTTLLASPIPGKDPHQGEKSEPLGHLSESAPAEEPTDIETVVHEARQRFRDTLPKNYLSDEEYSLYLRLYGPPLRETTPEDVGIPLSDVESRPPPGAVAPNPDDPVLLRQVEGGAFEEIAYNREPDSRGSREELESTDGPRPPTEEPAQPHNQESLSEEQLDYIHATARNQREYDALIQLQKDFEAAHSRALEEEDAEGQEAEQEAGGEGEIKSLSQREIEHDRELSKHLQEATKSNGIVELEAFQEDVDFEDEIEGHRPRVARLHPYTQEGRFATNPTTLFLPRETFSEPISELLERTSIRHIREAAEGALGGGGLPNSPVTPASKRSVPQHGVGIQAGQHKMTPIEADAFIAAVLPGAYASSMSTLVEVRKRLGSDWLRGLIEKGGPRVLDLGAGGAGLAAWQDVLQAEWDTMRDKGLVKGSHPPGKRTVVVGSDTLRQRISKFLQNTTFLPRLPDYVHSADTADQLLDAPEKPQARKVYDVIIASYALLPLQEEHRRKAVLNQLWTLLSPKGGVVIFIEKAHPRGFEAIAEVRDKLIKEYLVTPDKTMSGEAETHSSASPSSSSSPSPDEQEQDFNPAYERVKEPGMIVAPCTNHKTCPMYKVPGKSEGRKDFCSFQQRFVRPRFLQQVLEAKHRNHDDVQFSYVAVQRGATAPANLLVGAEAAERAFAGYEDAEAAPDMRSLPRQLLTPLKRKGHVQMEVCTPEGRVERWTVPRSFGKQAYHDARKAAWGDLWALGAKTRLERDLKLGRSKDSDDGGVRARQAKNAMSGKRKKVGIDYDATGITSVRDKGGVPDRRTKGGRKAMQKNLKDMMEGGKDEY